MNSTLEIGQINSLKVSRKEPQGLYLEAKDEQDVLLPNAYVSIKHKIDDEIEVFVYKDSEDRLIATTLLPYAKLGEFAYLEVVDTTNFGAFCDWGLPKHLFIPKKYQKNSFKIGEKRVVKIVEDLMTHRLIGVEKFGNFLSHKRAFYEKNEKVNLFIVAPTPLGFKVIVNNNHEAMLFKNEVFEDLHIGDKKIGFIKQIRKDGKIDASLQPIGKDIASMNAQNRVMEVLRDNNYILPYNYKTPPETIQEIFGLSKKAFKKTLTDLQEKNAITVSEEGIKATF